MLTVVDRSLSLSLSRTRRSVTDRPTDRQTVTAVRSDRQARPSHGGDMALSVPADRHRGLHGGEVVSDPPVHGGQVRPGFRPNRRRGLFLPAGGDRAGQTDQAADLGHRGSGAL